MNLIPMEVGPFSSKKQNLDPVMVIWDIVQRLTNWGWAGRLCIPRSTQSSPQQSGFIHRIPARTLGSQVSVLKDDFSCKIPLI